MGSEAAPEELVTYEQVGGVARVTINSPDTGNSLTAAMRDRIPELMEWAGADLSVRCVVLTGAGDRHFCTGANLAGPPPPGPDRPAGAPERAMGDAARLVRRGWQRTVASILDCEKPVIAEVNGTAAGGGAQLVLACDLVVMADSVKLVEVFVRRGIIPDAGGAYLLPRIVGTHVAKELMFLGDDVPAARSAELGIANRVVPAAELRAQADELAQRLASAPTRALALTKSLINKSLESGRQAAFDDEAAAQDWLTASEDFHEGIAVFRERRQPEFRGW